MSNTAVSGDVSSISGEKCPAHSTNSARLPGACRHANIQLPRDGEWALLRAMAPDVFGDRFEAIQNATGELASPQGAAASELDLERGAGARVNLLRYHDQRRSSVLHSLTQTEPDGQRNAMHTLFRRAPKIDSHQSEASGPSQHVRSL